MNIKTLLKIVMKYFSVVLGVTIVSSRWLALPRNRKRAGGNRKLRFTEGWVERHGSNMTMTRVHVWTLGQSYNGYFNHF